MYWNTEDECLFLEGLGQWYKKGQTLLARHDTQAFNEHRIQLLTSYLETMDLRDPTKWGGVDPGAVFAHGTRLLERLEAGESVPLPLDGKEEDEI